MALEIERKFLVANDKWRAGADGGRRIRQAYLSASEKSSVRIRIVDECRAWLTIKSGYRGITRDEFEYDIPVADAVALLEMRQSAIIDKVRHHVRSGGVLWEVDVFAGENAGLVIAEVELRADDQCVKLPAWIDCEVSGDMRYQNSALAERPFTKWPLTE